MVNLLLENNGLQDFARSYKYVKSQRKMVPRMLSPLRKQYRVECFKEFLTFCHTDSTEIGNRIITGDETWVHFYEPKSKQESMQWHMKGGPAPKKFKVVPSAGKVMATIFWDFEGILYRLKSKDITITGEYYGNVLHHFKKEIKTKSREKSTKGVLLLHDNAPVHIAKIEVGAMTSCSFEEIVHPPCSPD